MDNPYIYIIAGPNGAGKTTFANRFLPRFVQCREFLNADLIAAGLSPYSPESQAIRSAQLLLERQQALVSQSATFSFETTLAAKSYSQAIPDWLDRGYQVILFFLWLPSVELAIERVANRVREGGHGIPEPTIRRRYQRGLYNLFELYIKLVSAAYIYDGSRLPPRLVAVSNSGTVDVIDVRLFQSIKNCREL
ncbi:MAG: zeta toxin family protein [Pirellulaceae bacterium]|nr:zeta toxin family protein [Pirellulaceae bacterium]